MHYILSYQLVLTGGFHNEICQETKNKEKRHSIGRKHLDL